MNIHMENKKEILKGKVVALVKDFIKTEGGIKLADIEALFGHNPHYEVITALYNILELG
jgi:hypothetical protein